MKQTNQNGHQRHAAKPGVAREIDRGMSTRDGLSLAWGLNE
jgi:hypothetical protein